MASTWIFGCFLILGTSLKSIESTKLDPVKLYIMEEYIKNETMTKNAAKKNLTAITWAHAVNSQHELNEVLKSDIQMIEADIVLGKLINSTENNSIPVMGHPPANTSDISLDSFLNQIWEYNNKTGNDKKKGVKLDFKSTEVFESSVDILKKLWPVINYPIWLNADIIKGPVNNTVTIPVDPTRFFNGCKDFQTATLSIGWTTKWGHNYTEGSYTEYYTNEMLESIKKNDITSTKHKITFPVRAGIAAHSQDQLHNLVKQLNTTNDVTLTIWSSHNDSVNIEKLRNLIFSFGFDRIYLDVPEEVASKLDLGRTSGNVAISSFASFTLLSLCLVVVSFIRELKF